MNWTAVLVGGPADGLLLSLPLCDRFAKQISVPNYYGDLETYSFEGPVVNGSFISPVPYRYTQAAKVEL